MCYSQLISDIIRWKTRAIWSALAAGIFALLLLIFSSIATAGMVKMQETMGQKKSPGKYKNKRGPGF